MIHRGSRYADVPVVVSVNDNGDAVRVLGMRRLPSVPGVVDHVVVQGDRLDLLAHRFYGDPTSSWRILDANPEVLSPLDLLTPGRRIRVPRSPVGEFAEGGR